MKCRPVSIVLLTLLVLVSHSNAAPLTLQECLQKAAADSPVLKAAGWDSRVAQENARIVGSAYLPRLDAQAGYTMQLEPQAVKMGGITAETQEPDFAFAGISAQYTIYDFGRRDARVRQADAAVSAADQQFANRHSDLSLQIIESYYGILEAGKLLQAAGDEVVQVEEHRRVTQVLYEEGAVTRNDVLQAEVRLASARQKQLSLRNRRENIWLQLNFFTGSPPAYRTDLDESSLITTDSRKQEATDSALSLRHDLKALRHNLEASEAEVLESRSSFYPELFSRLALDYVQNDKVREQAIMSATVGIKVNLFDGFATSATRDRAVRNRSRIQDTLRLAEQQARLEIDSAGNDVAVARERIGVAEVAIRQSEENLRINRERYKERVGTATEVLDAQTLLTQTRTDYYRAVYDHQTATARLKRALGEL